MIIETRPEISRREFVKQLLFSLLIAAPFGRVIYTQWKKHFPLIRPFDTFALSLIRKVYPQLDARELVSVQPMTLPTAQVFYLDFEYGKHRT